MPGKHTAGKSLVRRRRRRKTEDDFSVWNYLHSVQIIRDEIVCPVKLRDT
jgi:hypothetical protein